jgi:hypothetical protein
MPLRALGRKADLPPDIQQAEDFLPVYALCGPYTMTSLERMYALWEAVRYIIRAEVPGSIVECGVWKGGSCMLCAATLMKLGSPNRDIVLYDTFEGMAAPESMDIQYDGTKAQDLWEAKGGKWCGASLEEVRSNMDRTGYPRERLVFVKGKVEETLRSRVSGPISLLRLDTDWFQSTAIELEVLFPLLSDGGVLIIDDYGHWRGQKQAVDSYFQQTSWPILFHRVDYSCRIAVKCGRSGSARPQCLGESSAAARTGTAAGAVGTRP